MERIQALAEAQPQCSVLGDQEYVAQREARAELKSWAEDTDLDF